MDRSDVRSIAWCEFALSFLMSGCCSIFLIVAFIDANDKNRAISTAIGFGIIAVVSAFIGRGMLYRRRWAWWGSWMLGGLTIVLGIGFIWLNATSSRNGDGDELFFLALPILGLGIFGLWKMATSELQSFVVGEE